MTINSRKVLNIYRSLDREQIQFVIDKKIEGKYSLHDWLKRLHKIAVMDTLGDDTRIKSGNLAVVFGIFTVFTFILTLSKPFMFFFPMGFFFLFAYFLITYFTLRKIDIGNHLRLFIVPMLEKIEDENIVGDAITLRMDFSNPATPEHLVENGEKTDKKYKNVKIYRHHWMDGEMKLVDGIRVTWEIEDLVRQTVRSIQDKATKMDLTSRYDITHQLKMLFLVPVDAFEAIDKNLSLSEDKTCFKINITQQDQSGSLSEGMTPKAFIDSLEEGYRKIRPKKEISI